MAAAAVAGAAYYEGHVGGNLRGRNVRRASGAALDAPGGWAARRETPGFASPPRGGFAPEFLSAPRTHRLAPDERSGAPLCDTGRRKGTRRSSAVSADPMKVLGRGARP